MRHIIFLFLCIFLWMPVNTYAAEDQMSIHVSVEDQEVSTLFIDRATGGMDYVVMHVRNDGDMPQKITIAVEDDQHRVVGDDGVRSLVSLTRFHTGDLPQDQRDVLEKNNYNITVFCEKSGDFSQQWCEGESVAHVNIPAHQGMDIPVSFRFNPREIDHTAYMVFSRDDEEKTHDELQRITLQYHMPDKGLVKLNLKKFTIEKTSAFSDFTAWARSGLHDGYTAHISSENVGTEDTSYHFFTEVESLWIGEKIVFSGEGQSVHGDMHDDELPITMPRFGKMRIVGGVSYTDGNGQEVQVRSDVVEFLVWPVHLLTVIFGCICFCGVCVLLYKYVIKNMFGLRKNKKNDAEFAGTYIVKDTDNIISIAQMFDVPWKKLAQYNKIDAPYILISGETIHVPVVPAQDAENDGVQNTIP